MRNLKKFLALVLAMVMAMSLMVTANAATKSSVFPDEDIDPDLVEAVDVLAGLKVFQGQNATGAADGTKVFAPKSDITRKEVAALIYRVFSTDVTDSKVHLYKDYADFTDVNENAWYAGYVGLCANHNIIKGSNNGRFYPDNKVTGYEVLAMILRVVGYDEEGEFTGTGWQTRVASKAALLHITDNLNDTNYAGTLNQPATREVVAELIFQTMVRVPMVTHNALGYNDKTTIMGTEYNPNLGQEKFGLYHDGWQAIDKWGNPGYNWYKGGVKTGVGLGNLFYQDTGTANDQRAWPVYGNGSTDAVATIKPEATQSYNEANVRECDVAHDLGITTEETFRLYVNSKAPVTETYKIVAIDTVTRVGGQGRETKVYYKISSPFAGDLKPTVTMVDTFLAKVTRVTPVVLDHNNHVVQKARADLEVFDRADAMGAAGHDNDISSGNSPQNYFNADYTRCTNVTTGNYSSEHYIEQNTNYTYAVGDYLLVRGYTDPTQNYDNTGLKANSGSNTNTGLNHSIDVGQDAPEKMAYETNMLKPLKNGVEEVSGIYVEKTAPAVLGKQTTITWNDGTHMVGGETKNDQLTLFMDYAGRELNVTYAWYYDQFGNVIGIGPVANSVNYGVITKLYSAFKQGSSATTGDAVAMAHVKYADGTEGDVAINKFYMSSDLNGNNALTAGNYGTDMQKAAMPANTVALTPVYDYNVGNTVMTATAGSGTDPWAAQVGNLLVAPVADINKAQDKYEASPDRHFGIIVFNMFKFVTTEDGVVTAIEVAGGQLTSAKEDNDNDPYYAGHHNLQNANTSLSKLNKTQGSITIADKGGQTFYDGQDELTAIWLDANAKIILNNGSLKTYTLSTLPSDVTIKADSEIDWVDVNGDLRADYVYLYGETTGTVTYGLFYYNGGAATWNGTQGTLSGWLNGDEATVTFEKEDEFKAVQNSQGYLGHLFALRFMDGIVDDVMVAKNTDGTTASSAEGMYLLYDEPNNYPTGGALGNVTGTTLAAGWNVLSGGPTVTDTTVYVSGTTTVFGLGSVNAAYGNPYDENTEAIYLVDNGGTVTYTRTGDQFYGTVTWDSDAPSAAADKVFYVTATSKIRGIGMGVTYGEAVLEYLERADHNDVTIVYDSTTMGIIEIYVATDPDITPNNPNATTSYSVTSTNLAMRIENANSGTGLPTLSKVGGTLTYTRNGVAFANSTGAAINGTYTALIEYLNPYNGQWTVLNTWTGTASIADSSNEVTLNATTINTLSVSNTYRITITVSIGGATDVVVMDKAPISAS